MYKIKSTYVECDCHDPEHFVKFTLDNVNEEELPTLNIEVHFIKPSGLWARFKYIFGRGGSHVLDEILLGKEQISKIRDLFNEYELSLETYWKKE